MLNTISRRLILSHLIPVLLVVPLMGFAFEFLLGTHALSSNPGSDPVGTICAHFQHLAAPFAGVIIIGLVFGSAVAWYLARASDRPLQKMIQEIVSMAGDKTWSPIREEGPQEIQNLLSAVNSLAQGHSEIEETYQLHNVRPVLLSQWLPQVLGEWREAAQARRLNWDVVIPDNMPALMIDQSQLKPTLDCLLRNVIYSTSPDSRVSVHFEMVNEALCITVSDGVNDNLSERFSNLEQSDSENARLILKNVSDQGDAFLLSFPLRGM